MKTSMSRSFSFYIVCLFLLTTGCATKNIDSSPRRTPSTKRQAYSSPLLASQDSEIEKRILAIAKINEGEFKDLRAESRKGIVNLEGAFANSQVKNSFISAIKSLNGVIKVNDNLTYLNDSTLETPTSSWRPSWKVVGIIFLTGAIAIIAISNRLHNKHLQT